MSAALREALAGLLEHHDAHCPCDGKGRAVTRARAALAAPDEGRRLWVQMDEDGTLWVHGKADGKYAAARLWVSEGSIARGVFKALAAPASPEPRPGQRRLPCGCITCVCEDPERCQRCGAWESTACYDSRVTGGPRHVRVAASPEPEGAQEPPAVSAAGAGAPRGTPPPGLPRCSGPHLRVEVRPPDYQRGICLDCGAEWPEPEGERSAGYETFPDPATGVELYRRASPPSPAPRPQTPRDPTGESPPLETDPRAVTCERHGVLLYPGELCRECLAERAPAPSPAAPLELQSDPD